MGYSNERKRAVLAKLTPPQNRSVKEVAAEEGIADVTLYAWRREARQKGELLPAAGSASATWSSRDWSRIGAVWLNPERDTEAAVRAAA